MTYACPFKHSRNVCPNREYKEAARMDVSEGYRQASARCLMHIPCNEPNWPPKEEKRHD